MQKFIVLYCMPIAGLDEWLKIPEAERKTQENDLKTKWDVWAAAHAAQLTQPTSGVGKTKRVTPAGIADAKNDVMLYTIVQGESHDAVAKMFEGHPHLEIPGAWIDISTANDLPGMN